RGHVARLALLAFMPRRAFQPLGIGAVDMDSENDPFVTRRAVAAFLVEGSVAEGLALTHGVVERAEEELLLALGRRRGRAVAAEAGAELVGRSVDYLVAVIAVHAVGRHALDLAQIVLDALVRERRGVARSAHAGAQRMLRQHVPARTGPP